MGWICQLTRCPASATFATDACWPLAATVKTSWCISSGLGWIIEWRSTNLTTNLHTNNRLSRRIRCVLESSHIDNAGSCTPLHDLWHHGNTPGWYNISTRSYDILSTHTVSWLFGHLSVTPTVLSGYSAVGRFLKPCFLYRHVQKMLSGQVRIHLRYIFLVL